MNASLSKGRRTTIAVAMVLLAAFLVVFATPALAANPAPVQVFFLSEPENDVLDAMNVINSAANSPMVTKISIAISADNTLVYYDHWEDGFANDIANPTAGEIYANPGNLDGVQIWGNGNCADGFPPQKNNTLAPSPCTIAWDDLDSGEVIILEDNNVVVPNLASTIDWDGKDKIGGTNAIAVSRSLWASDSNSLFAWANAMYPTTEWGQSYTAPVGCNTTAADMFSYTAFSITAAYDGTVIQVDPEGDGTYESNVTLNEGETYFDASSTGAGCSYIRQGGKVRSTDPAKPIQVVLLTGWIGSSYASRDLNLVADAQLSSSYWVPVGNSTSTSGDSGDTRIFIYNPSSATLYVKCEKPGTTTVLTIPATTVNSTFTLSNDQAGHCFAVTDVTGTTADTSRQFTGLATVDTYQSGWDWAVPFVPESGLSNQALVGLGVGRDWTSVTALNQNGSPLWVTPTCQTFFYVDWNNDGTPDKVDFNGDNDVTDTNVNGLNETTSNTGFQVSLLQSARLFDASDRDQTGAYIYTRTAANNSGDGGCSFAAAWGEDPRVANIGSPGLDLGTVIVSLRAVETSKASNLLVDADANGVVSPGDTIRYLISIENTGLSPVTISVLDNVPANTTYVPSTTQKDVGAGFVAIPDDGSGTAFPLDDPLPDGVALGNMPIGATWLVRFNVTVDTIPAGTTVQIQNCARIAYSGSVVITCVTEDVFVPPVPALTLDKTTTTANYDSVGDTISYSYKLTNSGNVPLTPPYAVSDNKATVTCPQTPNPLALGAFITCTATYTVTQADINAGSVVNVATGSAQYGGNPVTSNQDTVTVPAVQTPALTLDKTTTTVDFDAVGDTISYSYMVTNSGNVPLTPPYAVADNKATVTCPQTPNPLNPGAFITCAATYTVTQADLNAGFVTNIATATAKYGNNTVTSNQDTVTVPAVQTPALTLDKTSSTANYDSVGDILTYSYLVTNSGNVSLTPPYAVADNKATVTCPQTPNPLVPGAFITCTASYTVTQADINAGSVVNLATATAKDGDDTVTSNDDTVTVPALQLPALTLDKTTTTVNYDSVGDIINYSYKVTNSGNVPLTPPYAVSDDQTTVTCPQTPNPLNPGAFITCAASYTVTQADINAGSVVNLATATAKYGNTTVPSNDDTVTVPALQGPALTLEKSTDTLSYDSVGDTISYSYKVTNSGNVSLNPPYAVADNKATVTCPQTPDPLVPGAFITCAATYTVTQADITAGQVVNLATATANHGNTPVTSNEDSVSVPAVQSPQLTLDKTTTTGNYDAVGDTISYSYKVTNSGNVPLTPPYAVADDKATVTCPQTPNPLNPSAFITCTATYTVTQTDINAGQVVNNATATAKHGNNTVTSNEDSVTVPALQLPALTLDKSTTTVNYDSAGDIISYSYKVTNSGNVSLTPPYAVADDKATVTCPQTPNPLNPGAFITCTATYIVTQNDLDAGQVVNVAQASAMYGQTPVQSNQDTVTVPALQGPALTLEKSTTTANYDSVGDIINYSYKVTNSGNVSLTPPYAVADDKATVTCPQTPNPLNPGAFITCTASYTVTQADINAGSVVNLATATAKYGNTTVPSNEDSVTVPAVQTPQLMLDKTTTTVNYDSVGDIINYSYKVTNSGNVPLTPPYAVADDKATVTCPQTPNPLVPGAFITCTASYTVTQADINAGQVVNVASASALYGTTPVQSNVDNVTVPAVQTPALTLDKTTTTVNYDSVGDIINYSYKVTNSGNVPLNPPYAVTDDRATVTCPQTPDPLNPGAFITCTASYTVTQVDINTGSVTNNATATAKYGQATVTSNDDTVTVPALQGPALTLDKSTTTANYDSVGDTISYSYKVTNSGNVPLTPPYAVADDKTTVTCPQTPNPLNPGAFITCTASYTVTQADINAGSVTNIATATAKYGDNTVTSNQDTVTVPALQGPALTLDKSTTTANYDSVGDFISYSYKVTNSGNVPLTPPYAVADDKTTVTCPQTPDPLNPGAFITCTASYTVTQADINAGSVVNIATATAKYGDNTVTSNQDTVTVPALQGPALTLDKSTTTANYDSVGDIISYSYKVTNSGNVPLTPPYAVADDKTTVTCPQTPDPLNPGAFITCTASYTVTQADINAGSVTNIATATAKYGDNTVTSNQDTVTVPAVQTPALTLDKSTTTVNYDSVGDIISYSYKVTNSGNVPLTPPYAVSDNKTTVTCPQTPNPLNPGAFITCAASYTVSQDDINVGSVVNVAQASAMYGQAPVISNEDTVTVPALQGPGLTLEKSTTTLSYDAVGDIISYSYKVTNSGNVPLTPPYAVADNKTTVTCPQVPNPLNPGAFITCTATYTVTQADITAGQVVNVAQASAMYGQTPVISNEDSVTVPAVQTPAITLDKTTTTVEYNAVDDIISYSYKVTNSGNVPLTPPYAVSDNKTTVTCPQTPNPLNPGVFITCTATYSVTQADILAGQVVNIAKASAMYGDNPVYSNEDTVTVPYKAPPVVNVCPVENQGNVWTDILGIGMGNATSHKAVAKIVIPNASNVQSLYGQLAGKQEGGAKYVRFLYPGTGSFVQVNTITSPAPQNSAVFWYGTDLDPAPHIRGRWFLQATGVKKHIPRAFLLYPTYADQNREWVNVFKLMETVDTQVYWGDQWVQERFLTIGIPAPLGPTTFNVKLAMVDNDLDKRPVYINVSAGGVWQEVAPLGPNKAPLLNILPFTLANVPAGTSEIVIHMWSPYPNTLGLGALGGDSVAITGVVANYECVDITN